MNNNLSIKSTGISPSITLSIAAKAKKMKSEGIDIVDFGVGEPDFITPENIRVAAIDAINKGRTGYTVASGLPALKTAICNKLFNENTLEYSPENIVVSNGAKHSIFNVLQAICNPGDEVIVPVPYWVSYPELVKLADAIPVYVDTYEKDKFILKKDNLLPHLTAKTKAIILNSPNNPTGTVYSQKDLEEIAQIAVSRGIYVISDEIYEKLIYDGFHHSIASLSDEIKELTIVINGMSKCYAMPGWRIGYSASNRGIADVMANIQSHATSNPNTIAQYASIEALNGNQDSVKFMWKAFKERKDYMVKRINSIPHLSCVEPKGAFYVMLNISELIGKEFSGTKIKDSLHFSELLLDNVHIAVVPGSGFGAENFVRLSYATSLDNIKVGLDRLSKLEVE